MSWKLPRRIVALAAAYAVALNAVLAALAIGAVAAPGETASLASICGGLPAAPAGSHPSCPGGAFCVLPGCAACGLPAVTPQVFAVDPMPAARVVAPTVTQDRSGFDLAARPRARAPPQA